jgi:hypothetical protein
MTNLALALVLRIESLAAELIIIIIVINNYY